MVRYKFVGTLSEQHSTQTMLKEGALRYSGVGVLHEFLGFNDYKSPLYSGAREVNSVERFSKDMYLEFLEAGFGKEGVNTPETCLKEP